jgi:hypothetical protein
MRSTRFRGIPDEGKDIGGDVFLTEANLDSRCTT